MPNLQIHTIPKAGNTGTLYLTEVNLTADPPDPIDKNDIPVLFVFDEDVSSFSLEKVALSAVDDSDTDISDEVSFIGELAGKGCAYAAVVRFPAGGGDGSVTVRLPEESVAEGNPETSVTVAYSDDFPNVDWIPLFEATPDNTHMYAQIVSVNAERIWLRYNTEIHIYDWKGRRQTQTKTLLNKSGALRLDADTLLQTHGKQLRAVQSGVVIWKSADILEEHAKNNDEKYAVMADGRLLILYTDIQSVRGSTLKPHYLQELLIDDIFQAIEKNLDLDGKTYADVSLSNGDSEGLGTIVGNWNIASDLNGVYIELRSTGDHYIYFYDAEYKLIPEKRIPIAARSITYATLSLFYFQDKLFRLTAKGVAFLDTTEVEPPQPLGKVHPQHVTAGQRLDLFKFMQFATAVTFDVGLEKPEWVSLEANRYLVIADDAPVGATSYIRVRGINRVGASDMHACMFYIAVVGVEVPLWKEIKQLTLRDTQVINLYEYVDGADRIEPLPGTGIAAALALHDGRLRKSETGSFIDERVTLYLRAGNRAGYFADTKIQVNLTAETRTENSIGIADYEVRIEGIDVSSYLNDANFPNVSSSLDWLKLNQFSRGRCQVSLRSGQENGGLFNGTNPNSFWKQHHLNANGFLNQIEVVAKLQKADGTRQNRLLFSGIIFENDDSLADATVTLNCMDSSYLLKDVNVAYAVEGIEKRVELAPAEQTAEDETPQPVVEGTYRVESTFGELLTKGSEASNDQARLLLKEIANAPEGVVEDDTAFLTDTELKTQGNYLFDDIRLPVLAKTRTPYRYKSVQSAIEKLIKIEPITLTADIEENTGEGKPHIQANGRLGFETERGRLLKYPVDWIVDEPHRKLYYLLSNPVDYISDELVCHDLESETHQVLHRFDPEIAVLKLATADFDTFSVMVTDSTDFDRTTADTPITPRAVAETYDASLYPRTQILTYQQSEHQLRTIVSRETDYSPQAGLHYWAGVSGQDHQWQGIRQGDRGSFEYVKGALLYRWAKDHQFGVAQVNADGSVTALFTKEKDAYGNHLNFAFDVSASEAPHTGMPNPVGQDVSGDFRDDTIYFAFVEGTPTRSSLTIEKRSGNTTETLFTRTLRFNQLTDLDDAGGAWLGVQELLVDGENFYLIVPVSRNGRDISTGAGVVLYHFSRVTLQLTPLSTHDFVQHGACGLVKHDGDIYFIESPAVNAAFEAKNRNIRFDASDAKGFLKRIRNRDRAVETLGNVYFEEGAYNGHLPMKPLSFDGDLHFIMGYGQPETIGALESDASNVENWLWFRWSQNYRYLLPIVPTHGQLSSALVELAETTGQTLNFDKDVVSLQNRHVIGAALSKGILPNSDRIPYAAANRVSFPPSGYLLIGEEVIRYTERTETEFMGVSRGQLVTERNDHAEGDSITYLHRLIEDKRTPKSSEPYLRVTVSLDSQHLYNEVASSQGHLLLSDADSQAVFGEQSLNLNIRTTEHELSYTEFISQQYLDRFKDLAYLLNVEVKAFLSIELGQIVCFKYLKDVEEIDGYLIAMQVMSISTSKQTTTFRGRQVTPSIHYQAEVAVDRQLATDGAGAAFFADGETGAVMEWYGDARLRETLPFFEVASLPPLTLLQYTEMSPIVFPEAISPIGNPFDYSLSPTLPKGMSFDARTRRLTGVPNTAMTETDYTYIATDSEGQSVSLFQSIEVIAGVQVPRGVTDGAGVVFFADDAGTTVRWHPASF